MLKGTRARQTVVLKQRTAEDNWKHMDGKTMNNARNVPLRYKV